MHHASSTALPVNDTSAAEAALIETMGYYSKELGQFEASLWLRAIAQVGQARFLDFLERHIKHSPFAPKISDLTSFASESSNSQVAFAALTRAVKATGPWAEPRLQDPVLACVIREMGGWVHVNSVLPEEGLALADFFKRFDALYQHFQAKAASTPQIGAGEPAPRLSGLHSLGAGAKDSSPSLTASLGLSAPCATAVDAHARTHSDGYRGERS